MNNPVISRVRNSFQKVMIGCAPSRVTPSLVSTLFRNDAAIGEHKRVVKAVGERLEGSAIILNS